MGHPKLKHTISTVKRQFHLRKPVCPFISSTFHDFQSDRDYLVKKVFPSLDSICRERGTYFAPIDLRWGINGEQTNSYNVLQLCLDYVKQSAPFFICLIGERYGAHRKPEDPPLPENYDDLPRNASWLDRNYLVAAAAGYDWVLQEAYRCVSITELEIIQAFKEEMDHCFFYFRQPDHVDNLFKRLPHKERMAKLKIYESESEYDAMRVRDLKTRIVNKGLPVRYYKTPKELGHLVKEDWNRVLDKLYPRLESMVSDSVQEYFYEWMAHETFADTRRRVFVRTQKIDDLLKKMTMFASSARDDPPPAVEAPTQPEPQTFNIFYRKKKSLPVLYSSILLLVGQRGCGKTSMLANWVKDFSADNPDVTVVSHYVGSSACSTDVGAFMRRCAVELRGEFYDGSCSESDITGAGEDPADFSRVCESFMAAASLGPCVLVFDGIDELSGTYGLTQHQVKEMTWIAKVLPPQCKIVIATVKSDLTYKSLSTRPDTEVLEVPPFSDFQSKTEVISRHLAMHRKCLDKDQLERIVDCKLADRPLFLSILANELRVYGVYTRLDLMLEAYLEASSISDLWTRIVQRWVRDYSWTMDMGTGINENITSIGIISSRVESLLGWIADALRLIAVSRNGLSVSEILGVLYQMGYCGESQVTSFDWALFRSAALDTLFERPGGLLNFFHQHFREAVEYTLLGSVTPARGEGVKPGDLTTVDQERRRYHGYLADYFLQQRHSQRRTDELAYQLEHSNNMEGLCHVVSDPNVFLDLYGDKQSHSRKLDLLHYWQVLRDAGFDASAIYKEMLASAQHMPSPMPDFERSPQPDMREEDVLDCAMPEVFEEEDRDVAATPAKSLQPTIQVILTAPESDASVSETQQRTEEASTRRESASESLGVTSSDGLESLSVPTDDVFNDSLEVLSQCSTVSTERESLKSVNMNQQQLARLSKCTGQLLSELGHFEEAEKMLCDAHELLMHMYPLDRAQEELLCDIEEALATLYLFQLKTEESTTWIKKALKTIDSLLDGFCDAESIRSCKETKGRLLDNLGNMKTHGRMFRQAEKKLEQAMKCMEEACSTTGQASVLYHKGILRMNQKKYDEARECYQDALEIRQRWYGKSHPHVAEVLNDMAALLGNKRYTAGYDAFQAEMLYRRALLIRETTLGSDHLLTATTLYHLGKLLRYSESQPARSEAVTLLRRALDIRTAQLGPNHAITRAVGRALNALEVELHYNPTKLPDGRTEDEPFSSLSWHEKDLRNMNRQTRHKSLMKRMKRTTASRQYSLNEAALIQQASCETCADSSGSEREEARPALRTRSHSNSDPSCIHESEINETKVRRRRFTRSISTHGNESRPHANSNRRITRSMSHQERGDSVESSYLQIIGNLELTPTNKRQPAASKTEEVQLTVSSQHMSKVARVDNQQSLMEIGDSHTDLLPDYLDNFASQVTISTSEIATSKGGDSVEDMDFGVLQPRSGHQKQRLRSAHSLPSSTGFSFGCRSDNRSLRSRPGTEYHSHRAHKSRCYRPGPHSVDSHNTFSISGPNSSITSLCGPPPCPRPASGIKHHHAAWYHVPGRYTTPQHMYPPKRSQSRMSVRSHASLGRTVSVSYFSEVTDSREVLSGAASRQTRPNSVSFKDHDLYAIHTEFK